VTVLEGGRQPVLLHGVAWRGDVLFIDLLQGLDGFFHIMGAETGKPGIAGRQRQVDRVGLHLHCTPQLDEFDVITGLKQRGHECA
jgi:hypothetical protein